MTDSLVEEIFSITINRGWEGVGGELCKEEHVQALGVVRRFVSTLYVYSGRN